METTTCPARAQERRLKQRSRFGCRNCKLRKVKCDEGKPDCHKCRSYGVICNFISRTPDLHPVAAHNSEQFDLSGKAAEAQPQTPLTSAVWTADASSSYQLDAKCQSVISRYLGLSLLNPGDPHMTQVNSELLKLAFNYPFLMHASLAVALTYDRHVNSSLHCRLTTEECYHRSQTTTLLKKRLRQPIAARDKDPIWGTAAALTILTFSSLDASTPQNSWPLKSSESSDLDWLHMSEGKMSLWHILDPLRLDSIFHIMSATYALMQSPLPDRGIDEIPRALAAVCHLESTTTAESSPYFHAAHALSKILYHPESEVTIVQIQLFLRSIHGSFKNLLGEKDPVALLLLYLWYQKSRRSIWWIDLRARVECPSISLYLQIHHSRNGDILAFLPGGAFAEIWS